MDDEYDVTFYPDLEKVKNFPPIDYFRREPSETGIKTYLEYMTEKQYLEYFQGLKQLVADKAYNLSEHFNELLCVSVIQYELSAIGRDMSAEEYFIQLEKIEVAKLLLIFLEYKAYRDDCHSKEDYRLNRAFNISVRYHNMEAETTNKYFSYWMLELFANSILEGRAYYYHIGDHTFTEIVNGEKVFSLEKIKAYTNLKIKKPVFKVNKKQLMGICRIVQKYLHEQTHLETPKGKKIGKTQAEFIYYVLANLKCINDNEIQTTPDVYINSLYSKYCK